MPLPLSLQVLALLPQVNATKESAQTAVFSVFPGAMTLMVVTTKFKFEYRFVNTSKQQKTCKIEVLEGNCRVVAVQFATLKAFRPKKLLIRYLKMNLKVNNFHVFNIKCCARALCCSLLFSSLRTVHTGENYIIHYKAHLLELSSFP